MHGSSAQIANCMLELQSCRESTRKFRRSALLLDAPSNYLLLAAEFEEGLMIQDRNCLCFGYGRLRYAKVSKET